MTKKNKLRSMLLMAVLFMFVLLSGIGGQSKAQTTQDCLRCKFRCGVDRQNCINSGLPLELCEEGYNECLEVGCYSTGICPRP